MVVQTAMLGSAGTGPLHQVETDGGTMTAGLGWVRWTPSASAPHPGDVEGETLQDILAARTNEGGDKKYSRAPFSEVMLLPVGKN